MLVFPSFEKQYFHFSSRICCLYPNRPLNILKCTVLGSYLNLVCEKPVTLNRHKELFLRKMHLTTWLLLHVPTSSLQSPLLCCSMPQIDQVDNICPTQCSKWVRVRSTCCVTDCSQSSGRGITCYAAEAELLSLLAVDRAHSVRLPIPPLAK